MAIRVTADDVQSGALQAAEPLVLEECTVVRWRGYTRSTFVACLDDGTPVAESQSFKWRDAAAPHDGPAGEALAALERELEALGWTHTADGDEWYAVRYGRWVAAPEQIEEIEAEEPVDELPAPVAAARPLPPPLPVHVVREAAPAPQPVPVRAPEPEPELEPALHVPAPAAPRTPRRRRIVPLVSVLGILAALGLGTYIAKSPRPKATKTVQLVTVAPKTHTVPARKPAVAHAAAAPVHATTPAPRSMRLVVANVGHSSWLEIRRGSAAGPVLYSGILDPGGTIRYSGKALWVRFAAAANFRIAVDGRDVPLQGTVERVFSAQR